MPKSSKKLLAPEPVLAVKKLSVSYGSLQVVKDVSFDISAGDILAIIGPNGSGKTTLLKAILGLIPYQGAVKVFGQPISNVLDKISYVPQRFSFDKTFPLTVNEFLKLSLRKKDPSRLIYGLKEVEMTKYGDHLIGELSGGQLQRVLIARALLNKPKMIFLDEPTAGVDIEGEKSFFEIIRHLNIKHGMTIILISHEINMVYKFATKIVCINRDLVCFGQPKDVVTKEVLKKLYGQDLKFRHHHH